MISVVIATHNRCARLRKNINHLMSTEYPASQFEVIVVDDCSTDDTQQVLTELASQYDNFLPVRTSSNLGPAGARNLGIRQAKGEIIAITDDDIWVGDGWLAKIDKYFQENPSSMGVHGSIHIQNSDKDKITPFTKQAESHNYGDFYTGNIAYRRKALLKVGGFDENFPPSNEDMDLGLAILAIGPIGFKSDILVYHPVFSSSFWEQVRFRRYYWTELILDKRYSENYRSIRGGGALRTMLGYWLCKVLFVDGIRYAKQFWRQPRILLLAWLRLIVERSYFVLLLPSFLVKVARFPDKRNFL